MQESKLLDGFLAARLSEDARTWLDGAVAEMAAGPSSTRFGSLIAVASRHVRPAPMNLTSDELAAAANLVEGWNPERWDTLETVRARLLLARPDLTEDSFVKDLDDCFRHADEGEMRAMYKALCLLPAGERFAWRAGEGCRTNIVPVFESVSCDSPFAATHFDDVAWKQLVVKSLFIGAPLWRVWGIDGRLSEDLARMVLDLVEERRSAGREVQPELWLAVGPFGGDRAQSSLETEAAQGDTIGGRAAALGLERRATDPAEWAAKGLSSQAFRAFHPSES